MNRRGQSWLERDVLPGFAGFRDDEGALFYRSRAPELDTPEATAREISGRLTLVVSGVVREAARSPRSMSDADVLGWHRGIFMTTFPHQAGEIRTGGTQFGIRWRKGEGLRMRMVAGSDPARIREELRVVFRDYNAELGRASSERRSTGDAARTAATVYAEILRIHPFEDGNLRAAFPALQCALVSLGASPVDFEAAVSEHDEALGWALRPEEELRTVAPFAELLLSRIMDAGKNRGRGVESDF